MVGLKNSLLLTLLCLPVVSHADCEKWIDILLNERHHSRDSKMAICDVWPADESKSIVVLPLLQKGGIVDTYDLDVLLIDNQSGQVIADSWQPDALESDAKELIGFEIDKDNYQLNPETLAFGVRIQYRIRSTSSPYSGEYINLYVKQNDKLKPVVNNLPMFELSGENDQRCAHNIHIYDRNITLGSSMTNGYFDLIVFEKNVNQIAVVDDYGECIAQEIVLPNKTFYMYYNGLEYPVIEIEE
ncbi:hypothetical protein J3U16_00930 [Gilliamella sp. B3023]|uniref:hypothetical protein n=1 Tax=unclassified Gilliamella TaxID=2685620 RepID=UPI002269D3AE|nr:MULTISPECIES: hypothetical protein [unclassified Gilliamella]MCX8586228.1 hypothetical protein [Gilliamella sp. B3562]MCX8673847.1 hypothetical protein [Gilliamella sp. B3023]MCX8685815.1 hypothetical protein [Gilliamella sp. B2864]